MGQQQLLLLVLGIVIVGLAVVVGIQAFGENQKKANSDAITNDVIRIASDAQAWKLKPQAFGGPTSAVAAVPASFVGVSFQQIGYTVGPVQTTPFACAATEYNNLNGCYSMTGAAGGVTITGQNASTKNKVEAVVAGTKPGDITTTVTNLP